MELWDSDTLVIGSREVEFESLKGVGVRSLKSPGSVCISPLERQVQPA